MNEIIRAEYREIETAADMPCLQEIGAEIRTITRNMKTTVLLSVIEIGRRFEMAKAQVKHGNWGEWCEKFTGYSQSMAENYIKLYKEYGSEQCNLFGDFTKSQLIANLSTTKLLELMAVPAEEREQFVEENNVTNETTVKELRQLIKQKEDETRDLEAEFEKEKQELKNRIERNNDEMSEKDNLIKSLQKELEQRKNEPPVIGVDELSKMMAEADEKAKEQLSKEINRLEMEKKRSQAENEKLNKKYDALNKKYTDQTGKVAELEKQAAQYEDKQSELQTTIERLKKESMLGSNENMVRLNMYFETVQNDISAVKKALKAIEHTEQYEKVKSAISSTLKVAVEDI